MAYKTDVLANAIRFHGLVNKERRIATLEDKANLAGFAWKLPVHLPVGYKEKRRNGTFVEYALTERYEIVDVDGTRKETIRTRFFDENKALSDKKAVIGVFDKDLNWRYHGRKSANWKKTHLTLPEIIDTLNAGYAYAPGLFDAPEGESRRSAQYRMSVQMILFDADEWTPEHPAPANLSEFLTQYPDLETDFYWVGESISSRSALKPELRCRLMLLLPRPILKGEDPLWETIIDKVVGKYPFIARGVGMDKVRLSYGNARPECENRVLGGVLSIETLEQYNEIAALKQAAAAAEKQRNAAAEKARKSYRAQEAATRKRLNAAGIATPAAEMENPLQVFCAIAPSTLLRKYGLATHLRGNEWNWHESRPGRSFEMENGVIKPYANSIQAISPEPDSTKPVNAHRLILSALYQLDMANANDKHELRCKLADEGYGTHPDIFNAARTQERETAIEKGLIPRNTREIKLTDTDILTDVKRETLEDAEAFIQEVLNADLSGQVFALRVDTGTGKTERVLLLKGVRPILLVGSHDLGAEIYSRAKAKKRNAFLYRGLMHNPEGEFPNESPCIKPTVLDQYRSKGANAFRWGCEGCEVRDICEQQGMRWQHQQLSDPDSLIILAIPQLFIDPRYKSFIKKRLNLTHEDIVLVDDASTEGLFLEESISLAFLTEKLKVWKGTVLGDFAKAVKDILTEDTGIEMITQLKSLVESTLKNPSRRNTLYRQLRKARVYDPHTKRYIELSLDDAIEKAYCKTQTAEERARLQTVEKKGWTTLDRLRIFFKTYPNPETAPMRYDETTHTLHFALPPQLYATDAAIGFMGATLDLDVFRSVFPKGNPRCIKETKVFDAASTEWHPEAKAYQLRNNKNPRATLLKYQGKPGELSKTGLEFFGYFKNFVKANPGKKHALITYKSVIQHYKDELDTLGIAYAWFHNTEGLDTRFAEAEVFHVLGMPARSPVDVEWTAKIWGLSEDEVSQRLVTQELLQVIGRPRFVRKPNTLILYTSHKVPNYTDRCELTDENDWQTAGFQLSQLPEVIATRSAQEKAHQQSVDTAIASGNVQAVMEATGKSQRTAEYLTTNTRAQIKAEQDASRDAEVIEILRRDPDTSFRKIERKLKTSGHKRTDRKYIKKIVDENRRGKNATDNIYVNCPLRKIRSGESVPSDAVLSQVDAFFNRDGALHTPEEIAATLGSELGPVRAACEELYMQVKLSQGHGETYWRGHSKNNKTNAKMTVEQTASRLLAGKHVDGTPITERQPQTLTDTSRLPPHLQVFCHPIEIPKHLRLFWETIEILKPLQKYHNKKIDSPDSKGV